VDSTSSPANSNPDGNNVDQPTVPATPITPAPPAFVPVELPDYDRYLRQDDYTGVVYFHSTKLLDVLDLELLSRHVNDVHRSALKAMSGRYSRSAERTRYSSSEHSRKELARSDHEQLYSITRVYAELLNITLDEREEKLRLTLIAALQQAACLHLTASRLWQELKAAKSRGNVFFVDKLTTEKVSSGKSR